MSSVSIIPAAQRPIPLIARKDLDSHRVQYQGQSYWVVKDPMSLKYFRLQPEQYAALKLLDGVRPIENIRTELIKQFPALRPSVGQLYRLIFDLYEKGLAWSSRPGQATPLARRESRHQWARFRGALLNPLFIRVPGVDPHRLLQQIYGPLKWIFHPAMVVTASVLIVLAWTMAAIHINEIQRQFVSWQLFNLQSLLIVWLIVGACKILHELGHALACRHFGGECHEIGLAFLVFSPCLYCDVSDSWVLASKWKRMAVAAAGIYVEGILSALSFFLWWITEPGSLNRWFLTVFLVTQLSVIVFNLNPLLRLDGYYILSDWLEIPNLKQKSNQLFGRYFARLVLGVRLPANPFLPQRRRWLFALYAAASAIYQAVLLCLICFILYQILKPIGLQRLGLIMGIYCALLAVVNVVRRLSKSVSLHRDDIRTRRVACAAGVVVLVVAGIVFVPLPLHVSAPLVIEPQDVRHVYVTTPGQLVSINVRPGQSVERGQVLAQLQNPQRLQRFQTLETAFAVQQVELSVQQLLGNAGRESMASETLRAINEEVDDFRRQLERLVIVAPCAGRVISPAPIRRPTWESDRVTIGGWHGTPLEPENLGCFLKAGEPMATIAPDERFRAVVLIDQLDRHAVAVKNRVKLSLKHLPGRTLIGRVEQISKSTRFNRSPNQNMRVGRSVPADTSDDLYQAIVAIESDTDMLISGMHGRAKILVAHRSLGNWLWSRIRSTFNFHL